MSQASVSPKESKGAGSRLLIRGLSVLTALTDRPEGLTLKQVHELVDIPLGTAHRLLTVLDAEGFVTRSATTKRFVLGPSAHRLGQVVDTVSTPAPLLEAAVASGETAFLTRISDRRVVCVSLVESIHSLRLFVKVGQELPLHAAASARTILAFSDPQFVEELLSESQLTYFTIGTIRDLNRLIDHMAAIRTRGFDVCESELDENVWAVSAPVFAIDGTVQLAITIAAAAARVRTVGSRVDATRSVIKAAAELSRETGFTGALPPMPNREFLHAFHSEALSQTIGS